MDAPEGIIANAEYHARLLSTIAGLEYVPQAKKDQILYIKDLERQIDSGKARVLELAAKTKKERKEHEAIRDSIAKRFAHILIGKKEKFAQKASKEEREYVEALERELSERDTQNTRLQLFEEGNRVLEDLNTKEAEYESAKAELQALYNKIFDGPTEAFPEDDRLEYAVIEATRRHQQAQARVNAESRAAELLARAVRSIVQSYRNAHDALGYSTYDVWGFGGGNVSDYFERNLLRNAQVHAHQTEMFVEQARRISPSIQPLPRIQIAQGPFLGNFLFDNIFVDIAFHDQIRQSVNQLTFLAERLTAEKDAAVSRTELAGSELMVAAKDLDAGRQELDAFRRATFESYVAQHPPPPNYEVATNPIPTSENTSEAQSDPPIVQDEDGVDQFFQSLTTTDNSTTQPIQPQPPLTWGSRNPFAYAISEETRKLSE